MPEHQPRPPAENQRLIVRSADPFNAEPPLDRLRGSFITPQHDFYVRSHGPVPTLDPASFRLTVDGAVDTPLTLSLTELRERFASRSVTATLQCAGNRRTEMEQVRPVAGVTWSAAAIGTAAWTGVGLAEVLRAAGVAETPGRHVAFESADECHVAGRTVRYGVSIALAKAMRPEVLLAFGMNGEALAPAHGAPLRLVVPGYAAVRSPKWLMRVTVQDHPSDNHFQAEDYKLYPPHIGKETADPALGQTIDAMPLTSVICEPETMARLPAGPLRLRGYAMASDRGVTRVDVSADGGRTWSQAELDGPAAPWTWTFWHASIDLPGGEHELVVRAWDDAGQTQPARMDDVWNWKGYLASAWHRIHVRAGP